MTLHVPSIATCAHVTPGACDALVFMCDRRVHVFESVHSLHWNDFVSEPGYQLHWNDISLLLCTYWFLLAIIVRRRDLRRPYRRGVLSRYTGLHRAGVPHC